MGCSASEECPKRSYGADSQHLRDTNNIDEKNATIELPLRRNGVGKQLNLSCTKMALYTEICGLTIFSFAQVPKYLPTSGSATLLVHHVKSWI